MQFKGTLMLLGASFFWGTTFVAQSTGMADLGPFSYAAARYLIGVVALIFVLFFTRKSRRKERLSGKYSHGFGAGLLIGIILFSASSMQQIAIQYSTAGKAAFITCLYIVFVPIGAKLLGKKIRPENFVGATLAIIGLYLLAVKENFSIQYGDLILFASSFFWTAHILTIDKFASKVDVVELSAAQLFTTMILSFAAMLIFENPSPAAFKSAWFSIAYAGIMSSGVAFTLQIFGQKYAEPASAAILMSFEAIFGALSGWLILDEVMSGREIFGCILMLVGMIVTQFRLLFAGRRGG